MRDRKLESDIEKVKEFIDLWASFREQYRAVFQDKEISPEEEKHFLETKSLIARKYESIAHLFNASEISDDKAMDTVAQIVSLDSSAKISEMQVKKIESYWHNSYINFNKLLGSLERTKEQLAGISGFKVALKKILLNPFMSLVWIIAIIVIVFLVLQKTGLIDKVKEGLNLPAKESAPPTDVPDF